MGHWCDPAVFNVCPALLMLITKLPGHSHLQWMKQGFLRRSCTWFAAPVLPSNHWQFNVWVNQKVVEALIRLLWRMNPILCCTTLQSLKCCACTIVLDGFGCVLKRFERYIIGIIWESMGTWIWLNTIPYRSCLEPYTKRPKKVCVAMARASARNDGKWSVQSKETGLASLKRHFHHM